MDACMQHWEMAEAFAMFDKKGHRMISSEQLGCAMRALGENPTESEILRIKNEVDIIDGGSIGFTEFVKAMNMLCGKMDLEDDIKLAFKIFDTDGDGSISVSELRHVMTNLGDKLSEEEADELLNAVDIDGDGVINFEEFTRMILS
ncbi:hypothetical protein CAPTEDRAFT_183622 [Capitella teleta]|uniref:EF-hand domain-containing protein n=1 Tax=Capitella teleta TaxID=283909 RepID=R7TEJ3_CAPTE|nr:hypothetical protein CAPTEDRAFT_183622 [Capitella teleta]|eukprot:ELT91897.1 hypothetical protein CAPTEDRAFT_183622 [Capitella teleta]